MICDVGKHIEHQQHTLDWLANLWDTTDKITNNHSEFVDTH